MPSSSMLPGVTTTQATEDPASQCSPAETQAVAKPSLSPHTPDAATLRCSPSDALKTVVVPPASPTTCAATVCCAVNANAWCLTDSIFAALYILTSNLCFCCACLSTVLVCLWQLRTLRATISMLFLLPPRLCDKYNQCTLQSPQHSHQAAHAHAWPAHIVPTGYPADYSHGACLPHYPAYPYAPMPVHVHATARPLQYMAQPAPNAAAYQAYSHQAVTTHAAPGGFDYHALPLHHQNFILTVATSCWKDQYTALELKNKQLEARLSVEKQRYDAMAMRFSRLKASRDTRSSNNGEASTRPVGGYDAVKASSNAIECPPSK